MIKLVGFFKALYRRCSRQGQVEFRFIPSRKRIFLPLSNLKFPTFPSDQNIYFGVATRDGYGGGKENLEEIPALWVDFDREDLAEKYFKDKLKNFRFKPSIIVETGGGSHIYWLLKKPATKEDILQVESLLRNMASYFGADLAATDSSRILRVPGTLNIKYKPPRRVTIKRLEPSPEYHLHDFDLLLNKETNKGAASDNHQVPSEWVDVLLKGVPRGKRNSAAARLAGRYFRRGLREDEVLGFLSAWNQKNKPPLSETEIERIVESIASTSARKKGRLLRPQNFFTPNEQ